MSVLLSVIILAKNEEKNIIDCLESVKFCDEIVVIDDYSDDKTSDLVKNLKDKKIVMLKHSLNGDFASQRNFGLEKVKGEWVLYIDADERISELLKHEILIHITKENSRNKKINGYYLKRRDFMWGKELKYGETGSIKFLRLGRKGAGTWKGKVHETWSVKGEIGEFQNQIMHYPHPSLTEFLNEINVYTDIRSQEFKENRVTVSWWSIFSYPLGKFFVNYISRRGFLDGIEGLIVATLMSFHSFLVRGKTYLLQNKQSGYH